MTEELPEGWEAWLAYFSASLPQPVEQFTSADGDVTFQAGEPGEVIVHLTPHLITVSMHSFKRSSTFEPIVIARPVGYVRWRRLLPDDATAVVDALIAAARGARRAMYRVCRSCDSVHPPESMYDDEICIGCASTHQGSVN